MNLGKLYRVVDERIAYKGKVLKIGEIVMLLDFSETWDEWGDVRSLAYVISFLWGENKVDLRVNGHPDTWMVEVES